MSKPNVKINIEAVLRRKGAEALSLRRSTLEEDPCATYMYCGDKFLFAISNDALEGVEELFRKWRTLLEKTDNTPETLLYPWDGKVPGAGAVKAEEPPVLSEPLKEARCEDLPIGAVFVFEDTETTRSQPHRQWVKVAEHHPTRRACISCVNREETVPTSSSTSGGPTGFQPRDSRVYVIGRTLKDLNPTARYHELTLDRVNVGGRFRFQNIGRHYEQTVYVVVGRGNGFVNYQAEEGCEDRSAYRASASIERTYLVKWFL